MNEEKAGLNRSIFSLALTGMLLVTGAAANIASAQDNAAEAADQAGATPSAEEDTDRGWRPGGATMTSRQRVDTTTPQVTGASPIGGLRLKIGQEYRSVSLTGRNFDRVRMAFVADTDGNTVPGYHVRISSRGRTDSRLNLGVIAGPNAEPGRYGLVLRYETPDPRTSYRPGSTSPARKMIQRNVLVPSNRVQVSAESMQPVIVAQDPNLIPLNKPLVLRTTFADVPGSVVDSISPLRTQCTMQGWSTIRKPVPCPGDARRTTRSESARDPAAGSMSSETDGSEVAANSGEVDGASALSASSVAVSDEESSERLTQFQFDRQVGCYAPPPPPTYEAEWVGANRLLIKSAAPGIFPDCAEFYFTINTKNSRGQQFTHYVRGALQKDIDR